ncbi:MAG: thioredoxin family protein, partial [Anaerolineae bacterium]|nr:thioredoxin family protein [Anaerolineae bacterium]
MHRRQRMSARVMRLLALIGVLVTVSLSVGVAPPRADEPVVRAVFFWAETCPHCHVVMDEVLPPLEEEYGAQLEIAKLELSEVPENYEVWLEALESYEVPQNRRGVPMLFIGDTVLVGSGEIPEQLPGLIEEYLASGGVGYPDIPGLEDVLEETEPLEEDPAPQPTPTTKYCHECDDDEVAGTGDAVVHVLFFYDRLCSECVVVEEEVLAPLEETYGAQLAVDQRDVEGSTENYNLLRALETRHGVTRAEMPVIFIGDHVLAGEEEARAELPELVEMHLKMGGVGLPDVELTPTPEATAPEASDEPPVHAAYFYQAGCQECDRVQLALNYLQDQYPQLSVCTLDVREEAPLAERLGERAGVPVGKRLTAPAIFVGDDALVGDELHASSLEELLDRYAETGAEPICVGAEATRDETASGIVERFRSFSLATVLVAGLVDGLNPCAFATLVFFISYLSFMGREG